MVSAPYEKFRERELILRDELAIDRTILANERTILSYLRAAMTLVIAGLTFLHLFHLQWLGILGIALLPLGFGVGLFGTIHYRRMKRNIELVRKKN